MRYPKPGVSMSIVTYQVLPLVAVVVALLVRLRYPQVGRWLDRRPLKAVLYLAIAAVIVDLWLRR